MNAHVIIGTPATILEWETRIHAFDPSQISMYVLVGADVMIDTQGQRDQTIRIHK